MVHNYLGVSKRPFEERSYLFRLFEQAGVTQYTDQVVELARICCCSKTHARKILSGRRDLSGTMTGCNKYTAIADYFNISIDTLIEEDMAYREKRGPLRK